MNIKISYKGQKLMLKDVSIGGRIIFEYFDSRGKEIIRYIIITRNERPVMNG